MWVMLICLAASFNIIFLLMLADFILFFLYLYIFFLRSCLSHFFPLVDSWCVAGITPQNILWSLDHYESVDLQFDCGSVHMLILTSGPISQNLILWSQLWARKSLEGASMSILNFIDCLGLVNVRGVPLSVSPSKCAFLAPLYASCVLWRTLFWLGAVNNIIFYP